MCRNPSTPRIRRIHTTGNHLREAVESRGFADAQGRVRKWGRSPFPWHSRHRIPSRPRPKHNPPHQITTLGAGCVLRKVQWRTRTGIADCEAMARRPRRWRHRRVGVGFGPPTSPQASTAAATSSGAFGLVYAHPRSNGAESIYYRNGMNPKRRHHRKNSSRLDASRIRMAQLSSCSWPASFSFASAHSGSGPKRRVSWRRRIRASP